MSRINASIYTSDRSEWRTPPELFDALDREFSFTLDAAASADNAKCTRYLTIDDDALTMPWDGVVFVNPPYGRDTAQWIEKCHLSGQTGATVVALLPCRTDSVPWHQYVMRAREVRLIRGRLRFDYEGRDARVNVAPFSSAVVVFGPGEHRPVLTSITRDGEANS